MAADGKRSGAGERTGLAAIGLGALAIACCAGLPLLGALLSSVALGAVLGIGAGVLAAAVLIGAVVVRARARRRACAPEMPGTE